MPTIDYTSRDFSTIMEALKIHIQTKFSATWKDFYASQMGMAWMELCAYIFDVLSFYLDVQANESYLPTARDRESILNIGKMVGYQLRPPTSASVTVLCSISGAQGVDVIAQAGTQVTTGTGVVFEFLTDQRIPTGQLSANLTVAEGVTQNDTFVSDGATFQRLQLTLANVINGSITVTVNGVEWTQVDSLVYGDETSQVYALDYDVDNFGYVSFGNGTFGLIPPIGSTIAVAYRIGGGLQGNINVGEINQTVQGYLDGTLPAQFATVTVYNADRGSGGLEQETADYARYWIPRWIRTNGRAVTEEDFDTLGTAFTDPTLGSFAAVKAKLKQEVPELNTIELYTWARDSVGDLVAASAALKAALFAYFMNNGPDAVRVVCTDVEVLDGDVVYIDVDSTVKVDSAYAAAAVSSAVTSALDELFSSSLTLPGQDLRLSHIYDAIQGVDGVTYATITSVTASYKLTPTLGTAVGVIAQWTGTFAQLPLASSVRFETTGGQVVTDDGDGNLTGDVNPTGVNTVNYETAAYNVTFAAIPVAGEIVTAELRYVLDYQRGELEDTANGTESRFMDAVAYPPVVENTFALTDGTQVAVDDGSGNLTGDVDPTGNNVVNYSTGAYDVTFTLPPAASAEIRSTYRQKLLTPSEDIPITKYQWAEKGIFSVTTE